MKIKRRWEEVYFTEGNITIELTLSRSQRTIKFSNEMEEHFKFNSDFRIAKKQLKLLKKALVWAEKELTKKV